MLLDNNLGDRTYYIEEGFEKVDFRARNLETLMIRKIQLIYIVQLEVYIYKEEKI